MIEESFMTNGKKNIKINNNWTTKIFYILKKETLDYITEYKKKSVYNKDNDF